MLTERRTRRSANKDQALNLLLEAVRRRSAVSAVAVIDACGRVLGGTGTPEELAILGVVAAEVAAGAITPLCERLTEGTDVMARAIEASCGTVFLAALGSRVGGMSGAAGGVGRILAA